MQTALYIVLKAPRVLGCVPRHPFRPNTALNEHKRRAISTITKVLTSRVTLVCNSSSKRNEDHGSSSLTAHALMM
eukprot:4074343-Lingulodinium_polyedra.AAC.1